METILAQNRTPLRPLQYVTVATAVGPKYEILGRKRREGEGAGRGGGGGGQSCSRHGCRSEV